MRETEVLILFCVMSFEVRTVDAKKLKATRFIKLCLLLPLLGGIFVTKAELQFWARFGGKRVKPKPVLCERCMKELNV